jgi:hypothetical protein
MQEFRTGIFKDTLYRSMFRSVNTGTLLLKLSIFTALFSVL